jgi:hypothetical protein
VKGEVPAHFKEGMAVGGTALDKETFEQYLRIEPYKSKVNLKIRYLTGEI